MFPAMSPRKPLSWSSVLSFHKSVIASQPISGSSHKICKTLFPSFVYYFLFPFLLRASDFSNHAFSIWFCILFLRPTVTFHGQFLGVFRWNQQWWGSMEVAIRFTLITIIRPRFISFQIQMSQTSPHERQWSIVPTKTTYICEEIVV